MMHYLVTINCFSNNDDEVVVASFCRYKILVIIGDNEMVDVDLRKLSFCFFIRMSDYGMGVKACYHEEDFGGNWRD